MPRKKRPFLNKKTALRFEVVSRSLNDATLVAGEGSEHILRPMNEAAARAQFEAMRRTEAQREAAAAAGRGEDESKGATYGSYGGLDDLDLLPQSNVIIDASGAVTEVAEGGVAMPGDVFASGEELGPAMEHISLGTNQMPADVLAALEAEDGDYEEVDGDMPDDFVSMLGGVVEAEDERAAAAAAAAAAAGGEDFDMEAHMARLIAQAELEDAEAMGDDDEFVDEYTLLARAKAASKRSGGDNAPRTVEDMRLDAVLHEYDSDEIGELESGGEEDGQDDEITAAMLQGALDEFVANRDDYNDVVKVLGDEDGEDNADGAAGSADAAAASSATGKKKTDGVAKSAAAPGAAAGDNGADDDGEYTSESETELMEMALPAAIQRAQAHDVETIVSTYTTTDNHPTLLDDAPATHIKLSSKTGMPVIALHRRKKTQGAAPPGGDDGDDVGAGGGAGAGVGAAVGGGAASDTDDGSEDEAAIAAEEAARAARAQMSQQRKKGETKEQKRARKAAVKEARRQRRAMKKQTKLMFKQETKLQMRRARPGDGQTVLFM